MPRYRLTIAYDGTDFVGWQRQDAPGGDAPAKEGSTDGAPAREPLRSVQGVVETAVREAVRQPVTVMGASRTDSGVHARHQTAAFTMQDIRTADGRRIGPPDERLMDAINSRLPDDVLVTRCVAAADDFDPIKGCLCKGYEYSIWESHTRPLWERGRAWHLRGPLDVGAMDAAARAIEGTHDFASFAAAGHGRESTVRSVISCRVARDAATPEKVIIRVSADGFLWNMVRIIAGTLAEVGRGKTAPGEITGIIASRHRDNAGPTAPAHGLCLAWGLYEGDPLPQGVTVDSTWLAQRVQAVRERTLEWERRRLSGAQATAPHDGAGA